MWSHLNHLLNFMRDGEAIKIRTEGGHWHVSLGETVGEGLDPYRACERLMMALRVGAEKSADSGPAPEVSEDGRLILKFMAISPEEAVTASKVASGLSLTAKAARDALWTLEADRLVNVERGPRGTKLYSLDGES